MIPLPSKPKVIEKKDNWAMIEIEALYPGYGITIGNSLRRVLLSSLEGAAVTQIKIKGVPHEFSTIQGVLEDVITIMLNIKQLRFKMTGNEPVVCSLKAKGETKATGKDLDVPSQLELVNPEALIATLTSKNAKLEMEITVEKGMGYASKDTKKKTKLEVGMIPLDAVFAPIEKVGFKSENMRVGDRTDFDKVVLEIETDGTIDPEEAFIQASKILVDHFSQFSEAFGKK